MEWSNTLPTKEGKYIVQTKSMMGNFRVIEAYYNGKHWNFSNQIFVKYIKDDE